jgi:hypothetical protein
LLQAHAAAYAADLLTSPTDGTLDRYVAHLLPGPDTSRIVQTSQATTLSP